MVRRVQGGSPGVWAAEGRGPTRGARGREPSISTGRSPEDTPLEGGLKTRIQSECFVRRRRATLIWSRGSSLSSRVFPGRG